MRSILSLVGLPHHFDPDVSGTFRDKWLLRSDVSGTFGDKWLKKLVEDIALQTVLNWTSAPVLT